VHSLKIVEEYLVKPGVRMTEHSLYTPEIPPAVLFLFSRLGPKLLLGVHKWYGAAF